MIDRICIVGGSSVYLPEFLMSVISRSVKVREVVLYGRPGKKLDLVSGFCRRLMRRSGYPTEVHPSTDLEEAARGAKYVLNNVRVGGMQARVRDEKLPPKYGMLGHEALGAGGFANAMRTLPVVLEQARTIEAVNPHALMINLTNPMGLVVEALTHHTNLQTIGVTDLPGIYLHKMAGVLSEDAANLTLDYIGLNHLGWIQDLQSGGRSRMAQLLELLEKRPLDNLDYDIIELFRMVPTRQRATYFRQAEILKQQRASARFRAEILHEAERQILRLYEDEHLHDIPELTRERNAQWYDQSVVPLILALESAQPQRLILCVKNKGSLLRDLPERCGVEVPVEVSASGLKAERVGSCPRFLRGLYQGVKESERLTIEAVRHRSRDMALQALLVNPFVPSYTSAREYLERVIKEESLELH